MKNQAMYDGLLERRSIRSFKPEQVSEEDLLAVLKAGTYAPTAMGAQAPIIVAVQNPDDVKALNDLNAVFGAGKTPYYGAPTILLVFAPQGNAVGDLDASAVMTTLLNAAYAVGLGACWINRAQLMFQTNEGRAMLKRWGIEGSWMGVGSIALGYPAGEAPQPKPRKENYYYIIK